MTLYEMSKEALSLLDVLTGNSDVEMTEEEYEQIIKDTMESMGADDKLNSYAKIIKQIEGYVDMVKAEKLRLADQQKFLENNIKRMQDSLLMYMDATATEKTNTDLFRFSIRKTESVEITDIDKLPESCIMIEKRASKTAIKDLIKGGTEVAGAEIVTNRKVGIK